MIECFIFIWERISFNILLLIFKALHDLRPGYLSDMLKPYEPTRSLHSQEQYLLEVLKTRLVTGGDRAFSMIGHKLWNALPVVVKSCYTVDTFKLKPKKCLVNEIKKGYYIL